MTTAANGTTRRQNAERGAPAQMVSRISAKAIVTSRTQWIPLAPGIPARWGQSATSRFNLIPFSKIKFDGKEEWIVKGLLPKQGVGAFFGAKSSFKSFAAQNLAFHIAAGWNWAGRHVEQAEVIYIAAEGAAGLRKRKAGFELHHGDHLPEVMPFHLIAAAPNLGTGQGDLEALVGAIVSAKVTPGMKDLMAIERDGGRLIWKT